MTVGSWIYEAKKRLSEAKVDSPHLEARLIAQESLGQSHEWIVTHLDNPFDVSFADNLLTRRLSGEPLPYIVGYKEFFGRRFSVNPSVLIPREDTEALIDACLNLPTESDMTVLDVGTGSGIIVVTLKLERPHWNVEAIDISSEALTVAQRNAAELGAEVHFVQGDLIEDSNKHWNLVVSNPPYVAPQDELGDGVGEYEPHLALFGGPDGLHYYRRLSEEFANRCTTMIVEIGRGQESDVEQIFVRNGWQLEHTFQDLSGVNRVLKFVTSEDSLDTS